jgi:virginiamycin B lyase
MFQRHKFAAVLVLVAALAVAAGPSGASARPVLEVTEFAVGEGGGNGPFGIAAGPGSSMWFGNGDFVGRVRRDGTVVSYKVPTAEAFISWIARGPDGRMWFTENGGNKIGRIDGRGRIQEFPIPTKDSQPHAIAFAAARLWFTEYQGSKVGRLNPDRTVTEFAVPTPDAGPLGMALGPDGALWFTERTAERIGRLDPATGGFREFALSPGSNPQRITAGADGALWFTEFLPSRIGRITTDGHVTEFPLTADSGPVGITAAPDGAIWFAEARAGRIGRMDLRGTVTAEYNAPTLNSSPFQITVESRRGAAVWFTEQAVDQIGRLTLRDPGR